MSKNEDRNEKRTNFYFTFGQAHYHKYRGQILDKDTVLVVPAEDEFEAKGLVCGYFGSMWSMCYSKMPDMDFYPNGFVHYIRS